MSCGCRSSSSSSRCSCSSCTSSCTSVVENCTEICTALVVSNSWNVPACGASAVLSVPGLVTVIVGAYIWNPTYGWFRVSAFDSVNGQITVVNDCVAGNATPGSVVAAGTYFTFGSPPANTNTVFTGYSTGTNYTLTGSSAALVFGTTSPSITIATPGTYLITAQVKLYTFSLATAVSNNVVFSVERTNNTPAALGPYSAILVRDIPAGTYGGVFGIYPLNPFIYTTANSNDVITIKGSWGNTVTSGTLEATNASVVAVRLY